MNSPRKGKRVERAARDHLRALGFASAIRGQQRRGGKDSPDVICEELSHVHFEVKGDESIKLGTQALRDAIEQAKRDCGGKAWCVLWKRNRTCWRLTFEAGEPIVIVTVDDYDEQRHALLWLESDCAMVRMQLGIEGGSRWMTEG